MTTAENRKERLLRLSETLEAVHQTHPDRFNMNETDGKVLVGGRLNPLRVNYLWRFPVRATLGLGGWAVALLYPRGTGSTKLYAANGDSTIRNAIELLGLTEAEAENLLYPYDGWCDRLLDRIYRCNASQAAIVVKCLAETGVVDWRVIRQPEKE